MPPPLLSVIVVNWRVPGLLRACLHSLQAEMLLPARDWELVVVDNASGDGSVEMMRREFPSATLIANPENVGFGRANSQAFPICQGRFLLLLNPDTVVLDHAVDRMVALMEERPDVGAIGCRLLNTDGSFQRWTGGNRPDLPNVMAHFLLAYKVLPAALLPPPLYLECDPGHDLEVGWVSGACMLLRRESLGDRLFDERYFLYGEDLDLCDRIVRAGWKVLYTPRAQVVHHEGRSLEQQSGEVQLSKLRGLRTYFAARNGRRALLAYDASVASGFVARALVHHLVAALGLGDVTPARAERSRCYAREALRTLWRRGASA
jgi:hypothetical protein